MAIVKSEVIDITLSSVAAGSGSVTLDNLDGVYKIIDASGWQASVNTGAGPALSVTKTRSGSTVTVIGSYSENTGALANPGAVGTQVFPVAWTPSNVFVQKDDQLSVVSSANAGAYEIHFKLVRV